MVIDSNKTAKMHRLSIRSFLATEATVKTIHGAETVIWTVLKNVPCVVDAQIVCSSQCFRVRGIARFKILTGQKGLQLVRLHDGTGAGTKSPIAIRSYMSAAQWFSR